jgi:tetratricopeptide (TPR) repeat protein
VGPDQLDTVPVAEDGDAGGGSTYGRFISLGVIGRGGMGVVLRARDPELDRQVAIKLLGATRWEDPASAVRLQREAQAMAKLSHPNVVTVYEMGQVGAERFIAMELVEGTTLRRWLEAKRPWREVLRAFLECGRGLAAAHAAGLVHRDFKPENVLIGKDGRPRVTDFGLVAYGVAIEAGDTGDASPVTALTVRGSTMGTPAYMAPEQWRGEEVDARTDQFAFCIALWEGLYGQRPFVGATSAELREKILAGEVPAPPRDRDVPRWIEPILRRGLSRDRAARWPGMIALLAALDRPVGKRWPWIAGTAAAVAGGAVAIVVATRPDADPCPDPAARLAGVWDKATRDKMAVAFGAASPAIAAETMDRIGPALDRYAIDWRTATRAACRATHVDGTQSPDLLDRRMVCLERRRAELAALTAGLIATDRAGISRAVDAVGGLGHIEQCADQEMLLAAVLPTDPALRKRVDALEAELAASRQMGWSNRPPERQARAQAALLTARELGQLPQLVHALEEVFDAADENSDQALKETALRELAQRAAEAKDDTLAARAWISLLELLGRKHQFDEAKALDPVAEAAVARAGGTRDLRYRLAVARGMRRTFSGDYAEAMAEFTAAIDLAATDTERAVSQAALAQATFFKEGPESALAIGEQALAAMERGYGANHPRTAEAMYLVGQFLVEADQLARAKEIMERTLAVREAAFGPDHHDVGVTLHMLGNVANQSDDIPTARKYYERAIANFDSRKEADEAGLSRGMLAGIVSDTDGLAAGAPIFEQALRDLEVVGKTTAQYLMIEVNFARRLVEAGRCDQAAPRLAHAFEVLGNTPRAPYVLLPTAECQLAKNDVDGAIATIERGRTICKEGGCPPPMVKEMDWRLGKLLVEKKGERARGMKLVEGVIAAANEYDAELVAEINAWRKTH